MGKIYIDGAVTGPTGKRAAVQFLVDSGATYTLLPKKVWEDVGLAPTTDEPLTFTLADGTKMHRRISECFISLPQGERSTPVVTGEDGKRVLEIALAALQSSKEQRWIKL